MHAETWPLKRLAQPWPHESGWTPPSPMRPAGCDKPAGHRGRGGCSFSATSFFTGTGGAVCDAQVSRAATPPLAPVGATLCLEPEGRAAVAAAAGRRCRSADMQWRRTCVAAGTTAGRCAAVIEHRGTGACHAACMVGLEQWLAQQCRIAGTCHPGERPCSTRFGAAAHPATQRRRATGTAAPGYAGLVDCRCSRCFQALLVLTFLVPDVVAGAISVCGWHLNQGICRVGRRRGCDRWRRPGHSGAPHGAYLLLVSQPPCVLCVLGCLLSVAEARCVQHRQPATRRGSSTCHFLEHKTHSPDFLWTTATAQAGSAPRIRSAQHARSKPASAGSVQRAPLAPAAQPIAAVRPTRSAPPRAPLRSGPCPGRVRTMHGAVLQVGAGPPAGSMNNPTVAVLRGLPRRHRGVAVPRRSPAARPLMQDALSAPALGGRGWRRALAGGAGVS